MKIPLFSFSVLAAALVFVNSFERTGNGSQYTRIAPDKILTIRVSETGTISIGRDTVSSDKLAQYVQERLFKSFLGTGKMQSAINVEKEDPAVPDMVVDVVVKEIKDGQQKALTQLCLEKYKKLFEHLDKKQQSKLKKQFPVLFQANYLQSTGV